MFVSSSSAYGSSLEPQNETASLNPDTVYGISKMRGEKHVQRLFRNLRSCQIIRCANVFGYSRSMRMDGVINRFLFDANFKQKITVHGDGSQYRSFVHIERAASTLASLVDADLSTGIYNLVDRTLNLNDIIEVLVQLFPDMELIFADQNMPKRDVKLQANLALDALVEQPVVSLFDTLTHFKHRFSF